MRYTAVIYLPVVRWGGGKIMRGGGYERGRDMGVDIGWGWGVERMTANEKLKRKLTKEDVFNKRRRDTDTNS